MLVMPQITLVLAAACAILNLWLSVRVARVRGAEKVFVGDGGNERVVRRMRAHANFVENAWIVLALVLVIELVLGASPWLWAAAALFVAARLAHSVGMDGWMPGRIGGALVTVLLQLALAVWAVALALAGPHPAPTRNATLPMTAPANG